MPIVCPIVHIGGQLIEIVGGGDDVGVGLDAAASTEGLRPRRSGREQGEEEGEEEGSRCAGDVAVVGLCSSVARVAPVVDIESPLQGFDCFVNN